MSDVGPTPEPTPAPAPEPPPEEVTPLVPDDPPADPSPEDAPPATEDDPASFAEPETTEEPAATPDGTPTAPDGATGPTPEDEAAPEVAPLDPSSGVASEPAAPDADTESQSTQSSSTLVRFQCSGPDCPDFDADIPEVGFVHCPTCEGTEVIRAA